MAEVIPKKRLTRDEMYLAIAHVVAQRSSCRRAQVGAVVADEAEIYGLGYNGAPRGLPHCTAETCDPAGNKCQSTVHAEVNAILKAGLRPGATLYVTHSPCLECAKLIINSGIKRVVFSQYYGSVWGLDLLRAAGIIVTPYEAEVE